MGGDRSDPASRRRAALTGGLAGAVAGLPIVAFVYLHISDRPVGWASTNSDGIEDDGLKVFFLLFGSAFAVIFGAGIGASVGRAVAFLARTEPSRLLVRLAATWTIAVIPLAYRWNDRAWSTSDAVRCSLIAGAVGSVVWLAWGLLAELRPGR